MKSLISQLKTLSTGLAVLGIALGAHAVLPTYKTVSGNGLAASPAMAVFPSDPNSQIRIVSVFYQSDTNNGVLQFTSGKGAYFQTVTNVATTSTTNQINSTNGLVPNATLVLEHNGTVYTNSISTFNSSTNALPYGGTNVVLNTGGWGVIASPGDNIYQMDTTNFITVGAGTNSLQGEAIYVGNYGRPVMVKLVPALGTNSIPATTAHYDSQSN